MTVTIADVQMFRATLDGKTDPDVAASRAAIDHLLDVLRGSIRSEKLKDEMDRFAFYRDEMNGACDREYRRGFADGAHAVYVSAMKMLGPPQ